ncbi:precorrin-3B C17-methyltransferase [Xenococcus sp. PCC 7305]|uniref:precorrin-3B C(17)-methyltransferase n=1 Tax=Xenococcus sp. PCC 7305 TaxID=102125 RepID=UPI0002AC8A29|nr:precorrin-3B C(17)-methyltransferase [Xenococcus sp. PCC 7305]ELS01543.1 precorrin-3B C17-methyltransferase [Xenococcus sp. PCC 7305]
MLNIAFSQFQTIGFIGITHTKALQILHNLQNHTGGTLWVSRDYAQKYSQEQNPLLEKVEVYNSSLKEHLATIWKDYNALVFCLATGAVVRLIAPLLKDKAHDPAIIVIDPEGSFVISLCGGHQGGADLLTKMIALQLGATPIITGASSSLSLPGIDILGRPYGWVKGQGSWTKLMAKVANQNEIAVIQEAGSDLWRSSLPESFFKNGENDRVRGKIWISAKQRDFSDEPVIPQVQWHPRVLWVGIGCERGTSRELIDQAIESTFAKHDLAVEAIAGVATIDIKADEKGLLKVCRDRNLPLQTFPASILKKVAVPTPSTVVNQEVGTPSVAEASAIAAAKLFDEQNIKLLEPETLPLPLIVKKQIVKQEQQPGAVTVAIAQSEIEYTGKPGKLYLVGIGPGSLDQITPAAKTAIAGADVVIGYSLYIDLVQSLFRPEQVIESLPITQEKQRGERAIALASQGLTVAVISSGDCGIYGMAGLVLEQLKLNNWDGKTPQVQVFPGISALQAVASRVGAPLMHDFCAISLSDLLTPWEVIRKRLEAAAMADFVTSIYNPRSQKRVEQIEKAQEIFLQYRKPDTPVAIVRSVYRDDEQIIVTSLEKMLDNPIDMLTTIIIGNSNTYSHGDWMITPRGYL